MTCVARPGYTRAGSAGTLCDPLSARSHPAVPWSRTQPSLVNVLPRLRPHPGLFAVLVFAFVVSTGSPLGALQVNDPAIRTDRVAQIPEPRSHYDVRVEFTGLVVRTGTIPGGGAVARSLLLRDSMRDTLRARIGEGAPSVGSVVRLIGRISVDDSGIVWLDADPGPGGFEVVEPVPDNQPSPVAEASRCAASPGAVAWLRCKIGAFPAVILWGAGVVLVLIGAVAMRAVHAEWRDRITLDNDEIPLIVTLPRERTAAPGLQSGNGRPTSNGASTPAARSESGPRTDEAPPSTAERDEPHRERRSGVAPDADDSGARPADQGDIDLPGVASGSLAPPSPIGTSGPEKTAAVALGTPRRLAHPVGVVGDGLLQMLPGRLEVIDGDGLDPEIRFFRRSAMDTPEVTLGRDAGEPYRHVQLSAPTVSRVHARLRFADRRWTIANLSEVNPVVLNGEELGSDESGVMLEDGDTIRIGAFLLRYRDGLG